jgi:hypothetical protein
MARWVSDFSTPHRKKASKRKKKSTVKRITKGTFFILIVFEDYIIL